jgi:hypothetical protein
MIKAKQLFHGTTFSFSELRELKWNHFLLPGTERVNVVVVRRAGFGGELPFLAFFYSYVIDIHLSMVYPRNK